ncbi:MAG: 1-hydroxycarotenoid 3,4-desaturase CrtD [Paracoccaceae bacterium]
MAHPQTSEYETAVVIGAGVAGLAASIRLASAGIQVTLLERHAHLGGKIRTTNSQAGPVDAGPTVLTMRHVFDDLFACAGARLEDHVDLIPQSILARHFWPDGSQLDLFADQDQSLEAVRAFAGPKAETQFARFNQRTAKLFDAFDVPMMQASDPSLGGLVRHVMANPGLIAQMAPLSTLSGLLRGAFSDPRLRQLFGRYSTYVGGAPHLSPGVLALIWHAEASGVWVVKGGMHKLAQAMGDLAERMGVDIRTNTHVDRIETQSGAVSAVVLDTGARLICDHVIAAGDPRALPTGALGPAVQNIAPQTTKAKRSFSARVHSFAAIPFGVDLAHHNVFFASEAQSEFRDLVAGRIPSNPTLYICAEDRGLPTTPPQLERFEMIANAPATDQHTQPEDLDIWHLSIMTQLRQFGLTFTPTPDTTTITTPQTFAGMFPASQGALYGQSPHGLMAAFQRPTARTAIKGLYLSGGGAHPGAGVPMATLSARHAVAAILSARTLTSTSAQTAMHGGMSTV